MTSPVPETMWLASQWFLYQSVDSVPALTCTSEKLKPMPSAFVIRRRKRELPETAVTSLPAARISAAWRTNMRLSVLGTGPLGS